MPKRDQFAEGMNMKGFRSAVQARAEDRKAAPTIVKPSSQPAIPPLAKGQTQSITDAVNTESLRTGGPIFKKGR